MKKIALVVPLFILSCGSAAAQSSGWYAGLNVAASSLSMSGSDISGALANQGVNGANTTLHTTDKAAGFEVGYRVSMNFAVEGAYEYLGSFKYDSTAGTTKINGKYKVQAGSIAALGIIPFTPSWSFYGKGGAHYNTVDLNASSSNPAVPVSGKSESRVGYLLGVGIGYDFEGGFYTRAGWERYANVGLDGTTGGGSIDLLQLAVGMKF